MGSDLKRVIVVDVEATCWETREEQGSKPNEIIEIGACELNVKTGEITNRTSILVKPEFTTVSPFCTKLTGWTQKEVEEEGITIILALDEFERIYKTDEVTVWGSYGEYDKQMLSSKTKKGLALYPDMKNMTNPFDYMRSHINIKTLFGLRYKLAKEMGLERALRHVNESLEGKHHNGADDAYNIAKILKKVLS